jgi:hypothetical protein
MRRCAAQLPKPRIQLQSLLRVLEPGEISHLALCTREPSTDQMPVHSGGCSALRDDGIWLVSQAILDTSTNYFLSSRGDVDFCYPFQALGVDARICLQRAWTARDRAARSARPAPQPLRDRIHKSQRVVSGSV